MVKMLEMILWPLVLCGCPSGDESDECSESPQQTISPRTIEFGTVPYGTTAKGVFTVCGLDAFKDTAPYIYSDGRPWSLEGPDCNSSGTKCTWTLSYHPTMCPVRDDLALLLLDGDGNEIRTAEDVFSEGKCGE